MLLNLLFAGKPIFGILYYSEMCSFQCFTYVIDQVVFFVLFSYKILIMIFNEFWLVSQMDSDQYVPVSTVAKFNQVSLYALFFV